MRCLKRTVIGAMVLGTAAWLGTLTTPAYATLSQTGVCPDVSGVSAQGGGGPGSATDCNLLITFGAGGSITTETGPQTTYESIEDALIGVVNNSGSTLTSFNISGSNIFGFDGDGIDLYVAAMNSGTSPEVAGNPDTTDYGGPLGFFTNYTPFTQTDNGTVNFYGGLANGATTYFSLEEPINLASLPKITSSLPEPPTLALLGLGIIGIGFARRRKTV